MITILGPTASGKTALAAQLAARIDGEIISADSRQVYRGMTIGTGKDLSDYEVNGVHVPYHLIDIVDAGYKYSVYEYQRDFHKAYADICARGKTPILCGGSGMYIEAVVNGYCLPDVPPNVPLRAQLELLSTPELVAKLASLKALHNHTDLDTRKRIIRAIEIELHLHANKIEASPVANNFYIGIHVERDERRRRITERLHARLHEGLLDEVRQLLSAGISPENLIYYGLEYKFTVEHLTGKIAYSEMVERLNIAIHQFAKRQMTWFRGMERRGAVIHWIDGELPVERVLENLQILLT